MSDQNQQTDVRLLSAPTRSSPAESSLRDAAMAFAEDAQVFAAEVELMSLDISPGDAIRLFGKKLRNLAHDYAPPDVFAFGGKVP